MQRNQEVSWDVEKHQIDKYQRTNYDNCTDEEILRFFNDRTHCPEWAIPDRKTMIHNLKYLDLYPPPFEFEKLPAEIRNNIYDIVMHHDRRHEKSATVGLLRVSKKIHEETKGYMKTVESLMIQVDLQAVCKVPDGAAPDPHNFRGRQPGFDGEWEHYISISRDVRSRFCHKVTDSWKWPPLHPTSRVNLSFSRSENLYSWTDSASEIRQGPGIRVMRAFADAVRAHGALKELIITFYLGDPSDRLRGDKLSIVFSPLREVLGSTEVTIEGLSEYDSEALHKSLCGSDVSKT